MALFASAPSHHAFYSLFEQGGANAAAATGMLDRLMRSWLESGGLRGEIKLLEEEGDRISRQALVSLFDGGIDPVVVIRWKDLFERLEDAIDACEHVDHILEGIVVKQG